MEGEHQGLLVLWARFAAAGAGEIRLVWSVLGRVALWWWPMNRASRHHYPNCLCAFGAPSRLKTVCPPMLVAFASELPLRTRTFSTQNIPDSLCVWGLKATVVNRCLSLPLARVKSCATEYEPASAAVLVSGSSAHLERGGKGCEWAFAVCFGRMNKRGHLVGKQPRLHRAYVASIVGNRGQLGSMESCV